eukprot:TRINITY_DN27967_c0_g1_i1.p1 TRINITY_DN27967_c0_g1~~TRINITY_DN27967_c0_g1_i1.p1  ORF type:complete len:295 (-),score=31.35 TRINITY_DN27967_c0_g1_i1:150-1034(-)
MFEWCCCNRPCPPRGMVSRAMFEAWCCTKPCKSEAAARGALDDDRVPHEVVVVDSGHGPITVSGHLEPSAKRQQGASVATCYRPFCCGGKVDDAEGEHSEIVPSRQIDEKDPSELHITIHKRPGCTLGMVLELIDGAFLMVVKIPPGAEDGWESLQPAGATIERGDKIIEANGIKGVGGIILDKLRNDRVLRLVICRTKVFTVNLKKDLGVSLGMNVSYANAGSGRCLLVDSIREIGLVADWNAANPHKTLRDGDRILSVNDLSDSAKENLEQLYDGGELTLVVVRGERPFLFS